ncbi:hypothetical protein [Nocardioides panaciterrulae]|uniref:Uncharacterized protein n=1 Tax=Nocardioides panaciterrulae TaxID=661492 RepID=A0A7Y9E7U6_9ACTN|nr:hypothetical protein [Nocardioides panaciterrulae]NYD42836.1 hypothetical protein [Nocardioides panaciterrulae]
MTSALRLTRSPDPGPELDALVRRLGERVGLPGVLDDLARRARRGFGPGLRVRHALTWDREDRRTTQWWPQGVSTSADASETGEVHGRRMVAVSWYAKPVGGEPTHGTRISFLDLDARCYQHVLLLTPGGKPLRVHAGGLVWWGPHLHVTATARGFWTFRLDDLVRVRDPRDALGYRYALPARFQHRADSDEGTQPLRYSCLSLDRSTAPPQLVVGEYGRGRQTTRLARFALDPVSQLPATDAGGVAAPLAVEDLGVKGVQGVACLGGRTFLSVSHGTRTPGSLYAGTPGSFRSHRWASPMGPEDLSAWPSRDQLWTVTEHPRRRWLVALRPPG